jgi:mannose-6-phosphate isomerase
VFADSGPSVQSVTDRTIMQIASSPQETRLELFQKVTSDLEAFDLRIRSQDLERPWGGFFAIDEDQAPLFSRIFFPELPFNSLPISGRLSPKILLIEPHKQLSWQYHNRRSEIWKSIGGEVGVITSPTDEQGPMRRLQEQEIVHLPQGQRHRLVGLESWGVIAEIWQHTDPRSPSDENDIIRVQDDFGR